MRMRWVAVAVLCLGSLLTKCASFHVSSLCRASFPLLGAAKGNHQIRSWAKRFDKDDEPRLYMPPNYLITAVKCAKDQRVSVSDVSTLSGVELVSVEKDLLALAHVVGASLQVTQQGSLIYVFPSNLEQVIMKNSLWYRVQLLFNRVAPAVSFAFRASFGLCLVASLALIVVALTAAAASSNSSSSSGSRKRDDEKKKKKNSNAQHFETHHHFHYGRPRVINVLDIADLLRIVLRRSNSNTNFETKQNEMGWLESFYSFVFGDGDPNKDFQLKASSRAAQLIRSSRGVVVAEQLAPFSLDPPPCSRPVADADANVGTAEGTDQSAGLDEGRLVLPLLLRFGGHPVVTSSGNIAYVFKDLTISGSLPVASVGPGSIYSSSSTTSSEVVQSQGPGAGPLLERERVFSRASAGQQATATALAGLNLAGALALSQLSHHGGSAHWVKLVTPVVLFYAAMFTAVPLWRFFSYGVQNARIRERNERRRKWAHVTATDPQLRAKIIDAARVLHEERNASATDEKIVFDSARSLLSQYE